MARPYKLTDFDTLQDMATRFSVETAALQLGNRELQGLPVNANFPMSLVGTVIQLPVDDSGMPFDWQPYTSPGGEKLADICKNVLKDRRFVGSATGAAFLCASLFFPPAAPVLSVIGGVLVIGATVYGVIANGASWEDVNDLFRPAPEVWWLHALASFTSGKNYAIISDNSSSLSSAISTLNDTIKKTDFVVIEWGRRQDAVKLVGGDTVGMLVDAGPDAAAPP
jgi:hypothetical protein